ncbi:uncharacterized protein LOC134753808 [Cydia strobilella]|uniref:uncharacterized protein LOC134753808 n=1 Tax=Cydia strobilella TaxID=1100964 RepID=UPI0030074704
MQDKTLYTFVSFNCKNVKRSKDDIRQLCKTYDLISLQETWLLPDEICFLDTIDENFGYTGTSAVDTAAGMLRGRPYGGVALLWNKSVFRNVSVVKCSNPRICAVKITIGQRSFLVLSVYMPTDKVENLTDFTDCLSTVSAIVNNNNTESVYILGDFNAHPGGLFYNELSCFCDDQGWICADIEKLGLQSSTYTFVSDAHGSTSWLDHCLTSVSAMGSVTNVYVRHDVVWSDHFPLVVECDLQVIRAKISREEITMSNKIVWGERNPEQVAIYNSECNTRLKLIDFPQELRQCCDHTCTDPSHKKVIVEYYSKIISALTESATVSGRSNVVKKKKPIAGWNRYVSDAHRTARFKFQVWLWYSKPRVGRVFEEMRASKRIFRSRLKWCQKNEDQIKLDIICEHHSKGDFKSFWKSTNRLNPKPGLPVSVEGVSDNKSIANMFRSFFRVESPLASTQSPGVADTGSHDRRTITKFTANEVKKAIKCITRGKSPGHDGLSVEHLQHAGPHLPRVLAMLYTFCIGHAFLPDDMMRTVVVPIVKNKTDLNKVLKYWYQNQSNVVRWAGAFSDAYRLKCGVRQGGLTSPKLFNLYVNALIEELSSTRIGCHIDGVCVNNISYADDMVLLSASPCGLTKLIGVCERVLMGLPRYCSASGMFAEAWVDCFHTTMRKRCTSLVRRIRAIQIWRKASIEHRHPHRQPHRSL